MRTLILLALVATTTVYAQEPTDPSAGISAGSEISADAGAPFGTVAPTGLEDLDLSDIEAELGTQITVGPAESLPETSLPDPTGSTDVEPVTKQWNLSTQKLRPVKFYPWTPWWQNQYRRLSIRNSGGAIRCGSRSFCLHCQRVNSQVLIPEQPAVEVVAEPISSDARVSESFDDIKADLEDFRHDYFISGIFGGSAYNATNVDSDNTLGLAVGMNTMDNRLVLEGTFTRGQFFIEDANPYNRFLAVDKMEQMNFTVAAKSPLFYGRIWGGRIQPYLGALISYTRRDFSRAIC
ncbi:MAG: hypothetical protein R2827_08865 [Bdellovibrionales bacterium]